MIRIYCVRVNEDFPGGGAFKRSATFRTYEDDWVWQGPQLSAEEFTFEHLDDFQPVPGETYEFTAAQWRDVQRRQHYQLPPGQGPHPVPRLT